MAFETDNRLVKARDIEIENIFEVDDSLWSNLDHHFIERGIAYHERELHSLYLESKNMDLFKAGFTLRQRMEPSGPEEYIGESALKHRHGQFLATANEIAARLFGGQNLDGLAPYIRAEIERVKKHTPDIREFGATDLPAAVADPVKSALDAGEALKPVFGTYVYRRQLKIFIDATQFLAPNREGRVPGFMDIKVAGRPTQSMRDSGKYICLDLSLDEVFYHQPDRCAQLKAIFDSKGRNLTVLGRKSVVEYEFKPVDSGQNLTDEELVAAYTGFGLALRGLDQDLAKHKNGYAPIRPARSKAAIGFGMHPDYGSRAMQAEYQKALEFAP